MMILEYVLVKGSWLVIYLVVVSLKLESIDGGVFKFKILMMIFIFGDMS